MHDEELLTSLLAGRRGKRDWELFLSRFSNLILKVIWTSESDYDEVMEKYLYICRKLLEDDFARLRKFEVRKEPSPLFTTWLATVTHNLCVDAHRARHGRRQFPRALMRMTDVDRNVFRLYYWKGCSLEEIQSKAGQFGTTPEGVAESIARIESTISGSTASPASRAALIPLDENAAGLTAVDNSDLMELERWLQQWISALPSQDQMILRLRFWEDMTAPEIANAMRITPSQRIYPMLRRALETLRGRAKETYGDQRAGRASV